jgi:heat shock protein HslJ
MLRPWILVIAALAAMNQIVIAQPLSDQNFEVLRLYGERVKYEQSPSLAFGQDGRVTGRGGCNNYSAEYSAKSVLQKASRAARTARGAKNRRVRVWTIRVQDISSTRMFCGPASKIESRFFQALRSARRYTLKDGMLTVYGARGRTPLMLLTKVAM